MRLKCFLARGNIEKAMAFQMNKDKLKKLWSELKPQQRKDLVKKMKLDIKIADIEFDDLSEADKVIFESLLTCDDPDLYAWLMGHQACNNPDYKRLIDHILSRVKV